jgi:hypothetical protein
MTDVATLCENHCGGWEVTAHSEAGGTHILTLTTVSVDLHPTSTDFHDTLHNEMVTHGHRKQVKMECLTFDSYPTDEEIEIALTEIGFNPVIQEPTELVTFSRVGNIRLDNGVVSQDTAPIKTVTNGQPDVIEYSRTLHPTEYNNLYNMIPITLTEYPSSLCLKEDWIHLYYVRENSNPPDQFFDQDFFLYSVRVNRVTSEILRKGYNKGLDLSAEQLAALPGSEDLENIIAVGHYLDEPKITIYYMRSSEPEDFVSNPAVVEIPYFGTTWENGSILHTREYMRDEIT